MLKTWETNREFFKFSARPSSMVHALPINIFFLLLNASFFLNVRFSFINRTFYGFIFCLLIFICFKKVFPVDFLFLFFFIIIIYFYTIILYFCFSFWFVVGNSCLYELNFNSTILFRLKKLWSRPRSALFIIIFL